MRPARHRLTAWIASVAILLTALAPTLAQALASVGDRAAPWSEICTATGSPSGTENVPGGGQSIHGSTHCPWCAGNSHTCALPSADYAPPLDGQAGLPPAGADSLRPDHIDRRGASQPRAPPVHS